jgi:hypothetical protein
VSLFDKMNSPQTTESKSEIRLWLTIMREVSNFDGLIFTIDDGPSTRMTAALAPRFLKGV